MKSIALTRTVVPVIAAQRKACRQVALIVKGKCVAKMQQIVTVSKQDVAKILREIAAENKQIFSAQNVSDSDIPRAKDTKAVKLEIYFFSSFAFVASLREIFRD